VSTQTSTPVPSSSSEIFIIIGIITTMLFLICCCLVLFILCSSTRKRQSSLEYEQLEAQKQRANINSSRRRNGDDKVEYK
jgi:ABC-type transport system involved in multi-copper enzyme maturation permease subunit